MMENIMVAPVGGDITPLYIGLRSFKTSKIILITPEDKRTESLKIKEDLEKFKIPVIIEEIHGPLLEDMFRIVSQIAQTEKDNVIINVATGDQLGSCAALSAAFVNGLKAFGVMNDEPMLFPILKFSYYKLLTEKKMKILELLAESPCSLKELSEKAKMSLPLISYHINGSDKSAGLKDLGLVNVKEKKGRVQIELNSLGRLLVKGYIDQPEER